MTDIILFALICIMTHFSKSGILTSYQIYTYFAFCALIAILMNLKSRPLLIIAICFLLAIIISFFMGHKILAILFALTYINILLIANNIS